jgi:hypothetical protein
MAVPAQERRHTLVGLVVIWTGMAGVFLCLAGVLILGWQVYVFVKFGTWLSKPLLGLVLDFVDLNTSWLVHPQSYAVAQVVLTGVLGWIPVSVFLIVAGLSLVTAAHAVGGHPPAKRHWEESGREPTATDEWFGRN